MTRNYIEILDKLNEISHLEAVNSFGEVVPIGELSNVLNLYSSLNNYLTGLNPKHYYYYTNTRNELKEKIEKSYAEDKLLTLKLLFYMRDIRGGQGLRDAFKIGFKHLLFKEIENKNEFELLHFLKLVGHYGRFDDLLFFLDLNDVVDEFIINSIIKPQLENDLAVANLVKVEIENGADLEEAVGKVLSEHGKDLTLLAKWLPSNNASSKKTKYLARKIARTLGLSNKEYQKTLVTIRKVLNLVETKLSERKFDEVDYSKVPSKAMKKYKKAFENRDGVRYKGYLETLTRQLANPNEVSSEEVKVKVNTQALLPHEIVGEFVSLITQKFYSTPNKGEMVRLNSIKTYMETEKEQESKLAKAQWVSYVNDLREKFNDLPSFIPVLDASGSMSMSSSLGKSNPFEFATTLSIMLSELNNEYWKNKILTFSKSSKFIDIGESTDIFERFVNLMANRVPALSTDLGKSFDEVLDHAVKNNIPVEDMPKALVVLTDMNFNGEVHSFIEGYGYGSLSLETYINSYKEKFEEKGYTLPQVIVWNLTNDTTSYSIEGLEQGITTVSGYSLKNLDSILTSNIDSPMKSMLRVLNSEKYSLVDDIYYR